MARLKKCLVIGANGFVGSHLVDGLAEAGFAVRAFDRFSRPPQFRQHPLVETYKGDLLNNLALNSALTDIHYVFHCFSATTPFTSDVDPYTDIKFNLLHNVELFNQIITAKVRKVVFVSSGGAVYGHLAEQKKAHEDDAPTPVSPYGICKLATEHYLAYFNRKYGLEYVVYRLTNPYGPRQATKHNQGVIPAFLNNIDRGQAVVVLGDGSSSRDYIYIRDAVSMITNTYHKSTRYNTYNIGSGEQTELNSILSAIEPLIGKKIDRIHKEAPKTFLRKTQVSIDRFIEEFGKPSLTSLPRGIEETLHYMRTKSQ